MLHSFFLSLLLQLLPLQLFQDHRDGNLEASGMTIAASIRLSQAAFRLLYLSETSKVEEQFLETES
jgi:hypothetical protein